MNPSWIHLGGLFPTPLYHLHPCRRERAAVKMRFSPCFKINDWRHCQIIILGRHFRVPHGISDSIRDSINKLNNQRRDNQAHDRHYIDQNVH